MWTRFSSYFVVKLFNSITAINYDYVNHFRINLDFGFYALKYLLQTTSELNHPNIFKVTRAPFTTAKMREDILAVRLNSGGTVILITDMLQNFEKQNFVLEALMPLYFSRISEENDRVGTSRGLKMMMTSNEDFKNAVLDIAKFVEDRYGGPDEVKAVFFCHGKPLTENIAAKLNKLAEKV